MGDLKVVQYHTDNQQKNYLNLTKKNSIPFVISQVEDRFPVTLRFLPTRLAKLQLKNYRTPKLTIQFLLDSTIIYQMFYKFTEKESNEIKNEDLKMEVECNQVRLVFEKDPGMFCQELGLGYFLLFENKVVKVARGEYSNLSETHMLSDKKGTERREKEKERGLGLGLGNYHSTEEKIKKQSASNQKSKGKGQESQRKVSEYLISEDSIDNRIEVLCRQNEKGEVKEQVFQSEIQRLFEARQSRGKSGKKAGQEGRMSGTKTKQKLNDKVEPPKTVKSENKPKENNLNPPRSENEWRSSLNRENRLVERERSPRGEGVSERKSAGYEHSEASRTEILIDQQNNSRRHQPFNFPSRKVLNFCDSSSDDDCPPGIHLTEKHFLILSRLNSLARDTQLQFQNTLNIPEDRRISMLIRPLVFSSPRPFLLSGFMDERDRLRLIGIRLGLNYVTNLTDGCIVVATGSLNPKVLEMKNFQGCVAVTKEYLEDCEKEGKQLMPGNYKIKMRNDKD